MKIQFKYYLHDDKESWFEHIHDVLDDAGFAGDEREEIAERTLMPFYEVELDCELDTETGEVTVLKNNL